MNAFKLILRNSPLIVLSILLLIAGGLGYKFYKDSLAAKEEVRRYEELVGSREDYKQLTEYLAMLETDYVNERTLRKEAEKNWAAEREKLQGKIKALASATFEGDIEGQVVTIDDPRIGFKTYFCCGDNGERGPAVAYSSITELIIEDDQLNEMSFYTQVVKHQIQIQAAITKDEESGKVSILTKGFWLQKEFEDDEWYDIPYPLNVTGGSLIIDPTSPIDPRARPRFRFAPHLNTGGFVAVAENTLEYGGHIDVTLWGYGKTTNDLDWKLGGLGINFGSTYMDANLVPASYRIGNHLPLISDLWLSPGVGYGINGTSYFLTLGTTL